MLHLFSSHAVHLFSHQPDLLKNAKNIIRERIKRLPAAVIDINAVYKSLPKFSTHTLLYNTYFLHGVLFTYSSNRFFSLSKTPTGSDDIALEETFLHKTSFKNE